MELTLQQRDIYYEQQLFIGLPVYNIGAKIEIRGMLDVHALQLAYKELIRQHEIFLAYVTENNGVPSMRMLTAAVDDLPVLDFSSDENPVAAAESYMQREFKVDFDLMRKAPLYKTLLIRVGEGHHYIFSVYHHLITDGWGTSLMFRRFTELYNDFAELGKTERSYDYPYADYVKHNLSYYHSADYLEDKAYWRSKFPTLPDAVIQKANASSDGSRPQSRRKQFSLARSGYDRLDELAKELHVSTFHVIMAVLYTFFGRASGVTDFCIGMPVLNRGSKKFKETIGLFTGITPLRIKFSFEDSFSDLVKNIKNELRNDYRHQGFPLGHIMRELNFSGSANSLFNITLSYEKHDYSHSFGNTRTRVMPLSNESERAALAMYVREYDAVEDVIIDLDYNLDYFDADSIDSLATRLQLMLKNLPHNPSQKIRDIEWLTPDEYTEAIDGINSTAAPYPSEKSLVDLLADMVERYPERIAISDRKRAYTYLEVDRLSERVSHFLQQASLADGADAVGIIMDRSAYMLIVLIGVLKAGKAYIPLDPSFPHERLRYIVEQSRCKLLLADEIYRQDFKEVDGLQLYSIREMEESGFDVPEGFVRRQVAPHDLAYIIYTSGSTGQPKGVEIMHRSVVNFLTSMQKCPGINKDDRLLAVTTYSFDISVLEFFLPLVTGASVYIADRETLEDAAALIGLINEVGPTVMQATPSLWNILLLSGWEGSSRLKILCGGEALPPAVGQRLLACAGELWNMYGPTETTIWSTIKRIRTVADIGSIGGPIDNTAIYVLDQWLQPVPAGMNGTIYIGGDGLARGYRYRPDLTAERFVRDPFVPGGRMYDSGDVGKRMAGGALAFGGRKDNQVKIRGHRIEPAEIEEQLLLHGVSEAVVVAHTPASGSTFLVAFVIVKDALDSDALAQALSAKLPAYMVPSVFVPVDKMPLTPNGKIDRRRLMEKEIPSLSLNVSVQPANKIEADLILLWQKILAKENIGVNDNFFYLGGHSLTATRLVNEIYRAHHVQLRLQTVFAQPTVRQLAQAIQERKEVVPEAIPKAPPAGLYELSPNQLGLWLVSQSETGARAYNMAGAYVIEGELAVSALEKAFRAVLRKHESLRTVFVTDKGVPHQKILAPDSFSFEIDYADATGETGDKVDELIRHIADHEFDLGQGPLLKVGLIKRGTGEHLLVFVTHHIIADGRSLDLFVNEIAFLYGSYAAGSDPVPEALPVQYKDYSAWLNARLKNGAFEEARNYWLEQFENYPGDPLFTADKKKSGPRSYNGKKICFFIERERATQLREMIAHENTTLFVVLLSALEVLLYRYTGHTDICIGCASAGRQHPDLQDQLGMYANTLALRLRLDPEMSFAELADAVRSLVLDAYEHESYPFAELVKALGPETGTGQPPLFEVMMTLNETDLQQLKGFDNLVIRSYPLDHSSSRFPLSLVFSETGSIINCEVEYNPDKFLEETIQAIILRYLKVIDQIMEAPGTAIKDYDIDLDFEKSIRDRIIEIDLDF